MTDSLYLRVLQRAAETLGSPDELRKHLQVPMSDLRLWLRGEATPPDSIFLKVVDLLADHDLADLKRRLGNCHAG